MAEYLPAIQNDLLDDRRRLYNLDEDRQNWQRIHSYTPKRLHPYKRRSLHQANWHSHFFAHSMYLHVFHHVHKLVLWCNPNAHHLKHQHLPLCVCLTCNLHESLCLQFWIKAATLHMQLDQLPNSYPRLPTPDSRSVCMILLSICTWFPHAR